MGLFLTKRFMTFMLTLIGTSLVIFLVLEILPGDAAQVLMGPDAPPEVVENLRHQLGLDRPPMERYFNWVGGLVTGNFGLSYAYSTPIFDLIRDRLAVTVPLAVMAMILTIVAALSLGLVAAARHGKAADVGLMSFSQLGISIPGFWFGILLILLFAVQLRWVSAGGFPGWSNGLWPAFRALLLPAISLATVEAAILARVTRSSVLEVLREDFVRTARAKGLTQRSTLMHHVLRNALIPVITITGLRFANLLAGTIVIENVFFLPGLGRLIFQAISNRDLNVVKDAVMLIAATVVMVNFLVDILYAVIDPRLRAHDI